MMTHSGKLRNMASIYLRRQNEILLLFRQGHSIVSNMWIGSAGGHFEASEFADAKACVLRELQEELAIDVSSLSNLNLRYVTLRYTDGEIRQNYYFFAELIDPTIQVPLSTEGFTQWFPLDKLSNLKMPFTARHMIDHYIETGQYTDHLYGGLATDASVHFEIL